MQACITSVINKLKPLLIESPLKANTISLSENTIMKVKNFTRGRRRPEAREVIGELGAVPLSQERRPPEMELWSVITGNGAEVCGGRAGVVRRGEGGGGAEQNQQIRGLAT
nr:hypothetical protein Iba_chr06cCG11600 [Ipomoea batatas]